LYFEEVMMERHIIRHFTFVFALGYATAALGQQGDLLISRPRHSTLTLFAEACTFYFSAQAHGHQFSLESDGLGPPEASPTIKP